MLTNKFGSRRNWSTTAAAAAAAGPVTATAAVSAAVHSSAAAAAAATAAAAAGPASATAAIAIAAVCSYHAISTDDGYEVCRLQGRRMKNESGKRGKSERALKIII